ncbi:hypothetical protein WH96_20625 [Kiloniella spongiae]|uniref:Uncharacterized protein n=1 Tax=Kiloniella spongiae TaxID=1489064 RepID=A0A0H2M8Q7_9PROT|nr:hypothetical protein [Kiloniella spongiae]KLN58889.1 hypothetical protein WH96_20625 [Kiloniella spongiae]
MVGENLLRTRPGSVRIAQAPKLCLIDERDLAEFLVHLLGCPLVGKEDFPTEALYLERFNASFLKGAGTFIHGEDTDSIFISLCDLTLGFVTNALQLGDIR